MQVSSGQSLQPRTVTRHSDTRLLGCAKAMYCTLNMAINSRWFASDTRLFGCVDGKGTVLHVEHSKRQFSFAGLLLWLYGHCLARSKNMSTMSNGSNKRNACGLCRSKSQRARRLRQSLLLEASRRTQDGNMKKTAVRPSPIHGKGLFATTDLREGELVHPIEGEIVLRVSKSKFAIRLPQRRTLILSGKCRFVNSGFGEETNVVFDMKREHIISIRDIAAGEELLARYESVLG